MMNFIYYFEHTLLSYANCIIHISEHRPTQLIKPQFDSIHTSVGKYPKYEPMLYVKFGFTLLNYTTTLIVIDKIMLIRK